MFSWAYPIIMLASISICWLLLRKTQRGLPISTVQKIGLGIGGFCGAMLSAKLPFLIANFDSAFQENTWLVDGKTIMVGIAGGYLGVEFAKWILDVKSRTGDSFAFPVAVGIAIGRIACFSASCCYGIETTLPWGVHFPVDSDASVMRHPTQIYEFLFHSVCAVVLFWEFRRLYVTNLASPFERRYFQYNLIKIYIALYMAYRFLTEYLRPEVVYDFGITFYQLMALLLLPVFVGLWVADVYSHRKPIQT